MIDGVPPFSPSRAVDHTFRLAVATVAAQLRQVEFRLQTLCQLV